jgi:hypothetical protein
LFNDALDGKSKAGETKAAAIEREAAFCLVASFALSLTHVIARWLLDESQFLFMRANSAITSCNACVNQKTTSKLSALPRRL